jgi:hypothetical protein
MNLSFSIYSFGSSYYKEDKFDVSFGPNDTINTPNWIVAKYSPSYLEIGVSKRFHVNNIVDIEPGIFLAYMVELYGTSRLTLLDSAYAQVEKHIFYFNKEFPNNEYDEINYGLRISISLYPGKILHPFIIYTQSLNDLSKENININQHANLWSLGIGLAYSFSNNKNKQRTDSL